MDINGKIQKTVYAKCQLRLLFCLFRAVLSVFVFVWVILSCALKLDRICLVCNIFSLNISLIYINS